MTRLVHRPIRITCWQADLPKMFVETEGTKVHIIAVHLDHWSETGAWWQGELQSEICVVLTTEQYIFEIAGHDENWHIQRIWD